MKFYNREKELDILKSIELQSFDGARMTCIVGRRRIGKTTLIKESYKNSKFIYLFVSKKDETLLCEEFAEIADAQAGIKIFGKFSHFKDFFSYMMEVSKSVPFTLAIDEFQEFEKLNSSIYSDMQNIWDANKQDSKMNLILSGSIYSMMKKIFENNKEPLFGRADRKIHLKSFRIDTLKEILKEHYPEYSAEDLLTLYIITGGAAKYVELFVNEKIYTYNGMIDYVFSQNSLFLDEGKNILIEEFGKEYATYFSILSLISDSKTSRSEIESILGKNVGGYIERLEKDYSLIKKIKPVFSKPGTRIQKYYIDDNFLNFWFRYIYKYKSAIEIENYDLVKQYVKGNFRTYAGRLLEKYFVEMLSLRNEYTEIGTYWESGNQNEIDIVAINEFKKTALIAEVKYSPEKCNLNSLKKKAENLTEKLKKYKIEYKLFSINDVK